MAKKKSVVHLLSSTHWDREWYQPFEHYRGRLVDTLDQTLDVLEKDPEYRCFHLDGQAVMLEDYLTIRPENEDRIRSHIQSGRMLPGPWYVLSDEALVSGESLVRNLLLGREISENFGNLNQSGYVCDLFGHCSQLPQILLGFGIDNTWLWRGANDEDVPLDFLWVASDGSEVLAHRFANKYGYGHFSAAWSEAITTKGYSQAKAVAKTRELIDEEQKRCPGCRHLALMDGMDHQPVRPQTAKLIQTFNRKYDDLEIVHSTMEDFMATLRQRANKLDRVRGELRQINKRGPGNHLLAGTLSSRVDLKQRNARCETLLTRWAEPFSILAAPALQDRARGFLRLAWRELLKNHPHDSICGCSIDQVHRDMHHRFDQVELICDDLTGRALDRLARRITSLSTEKEVRFVLFNPATRPVNHALEIDVDLPLDWPTKFFEYFGYEDKPGFVVLDADGQEVPYQLLGTEKAKGRWRHMAAGPYERPEVWRVRLALTPRLDAIGWSSYTVRPHEGPIRYLDSLSPAPNVIENDFLRVEVNQNGSFSLMHKKTGEVYSNLSTYLDSAEIGDGWNNTSPIADQVFTPLASGSEVALIADGSELATLQIRYRLSLPARFDFHKMRRGEDRKDLIITTRLTLAKGDDVLRVHTEIDNTVRDHCLRVRFPSCADAETYLADSAFDVIERPVKILDCSRLVELERPVRAQQKFCAIGEGKRGLAVVAPGQYEAGVEDSPEKAILLTLFRSFAKTVMSPEERDGQLPGRLTFDYAILLFAGKTPIGKLFHVADEVAGGVRVAYPEEHEKNSTEKSTDSYPWALSPTGSFLTLKSGDLQLSAFKPAEDGNGTILRLFNPLDSEVKEKLTFLKGLYSSAEEVNLKEKSICPLSIRRGCELSLTVAPKKIITIRLQP